MKENKSNTLTLNSTLTSENDDRYNDIFSRTIRSYKLLSKEETYELIKRVKEGDNEAYSTLVYSNLRLVIYLASKNIVSGILDLDDLIQIGYEGLLKACKCENFSPDKDINFASYLTSAINNAIYDGKKKFTPLHLKKKSQYEKIIKLGKASSSLCQKLEREPTVSELAKETQIDVSEVEELLEIRDISRTCSLEDYLSYEENLKDEKTTEDNFTDKVKFDYSKSISPRDAKILEMIFGINEDNRKYTLKEIANEFNISVQRVDQLKKRAIEILRKEVTNK